MQTTGSTTVSPGWSRRTRIVVGVTVLVVLVVWFGVLTVGYIYPGALYPPSKAKQAEVIASLTNQVRQAYGADLASVNISYARDGLIPRFVGEYRLKDLPLRFSFSLRYADLGHYQDPAGVDTSAVGGSKRFVQLATMFHEDFPDEKTMGYWPVIYPEQLSRPLRSVVTRPGPTVVVQGSSVDARTREPHTLGVYSWKPKAKAWELVHRGELPESQD